MNPERMNGTAKYGNYTAGLEKLNFNDSTFARDYEARMTAEGYPGGLIDTVDSLLSGFTRIIDIGAGTGLFSVPMARRGHRVTAVEPSKEMVGIFKEKLLSGDVSSIGIHNCSWEEWRPWRHDAALCAHSIYGMTDVTRALEKMRNFADITVLLVRCDSESTTLSGIIKARLGGNSCTKDFAVKVTSSLEALGIAYTSQPVIQKRYSRFSDIADEAEYFARHTGAGDEFHSAIVEILEEHAVRAGGAYEFENIYSDRMIVF